MFIRLSVVFMLVFWAVTSAPPAYGANAQKVFVEKCMVCHKTGGKAQPVNPSSKAAMVWAKYFSRGRHQVDLSKELNTEETKAVLQYLMRHAADSEQPLTAVLPK